MTSIFTESINILAMVILGGMGNLFGVILGAVLIVALPELFREFDQYRLLAFGLMLMVLMVFRPQGLLAFGACTRGVARSAVGPAWRAPGAILASLTRVGQLNVEHQHALGSGPAGTQGDALPGGGGCGTVSDQATVANGGRR